MRYTSAHLIMVMNHSQRFGDLEVGGKFAEDVHVEPFYIQVTWKHLEYDLEYN
jgi:hypothetical protein